MARSLQPSLSAEHLAPRSQVRVQLPVCSLRFNVPVPSELWGAAELAAKLSRGFGGGAVGHPAARPPPAAKAMAPGSPAEVPPERRAPAQSVAEALEFKASLTLAEEGACFLLTAALCTALYLATAPPAFKLSYALGMAAVCAALLATARGWLVERQYKAVQRSERELAGPSALFKRIDGVEIHYTRQPAPRAAAAAAPVATAHCLHGFGASAYSWSFVQRTLAEALAGTCTAHDMPGFGLTQRPRAPRFYALGFNGAAARAFMDEAAKGEAAQGAGGRAGKRVLIGHSMGAAAAAEAVIENPQAVDVLVLVAPAIMALWKGPPEAAGSDPVATGVALVSEFVSAQDLPPGALGSTDSVSSDEALSGSGSEAQEAAGMAPPASACAAEAGGFRGPRSRRPPPRRTAARVASAVTQAVLAQAARLLLEALTPLLVLLLRRLVRSRAFWERGLAAAWADKARVTRQYVDAYRLPQLVRGWEGGMLRFLKGRFSEKAGLFAAVSHAVHGDGHLSQAERLAAACAAGGVAVLILHGVEDALVPVANSRRLARALPGAALVEFEACGHMPHEECPERFVREVAGFVASL